MSDKDRIKLLEKKVKACDDLLNNFSYCINAVSESDKVFKNALMKLQKSIDRYKKL